MKKVAIVTDSNAGIRQEEAKELGIFVLPMPFTIDDQTYYEDINLTQEEFFEKQISSVFFCFERQIDESFIIGFRNKIHEF